MGYFFIYTQRYSGLMPGVSQYLALYCQILNPGWLSAKPEPPCRVLGLIFHIQCLIPRESRKKASPSLHTGILWQLDPTMGPFRVEGQSFPERLQISWVSWPADKVWLPPSQSMFRDPPHQRTCHWKRRKSQSTGWNRTWLPRSMGVSGLPGDGVRWGAQTVSNMVDLVLHNQL